MPTLLDLLDNAVTRYGDRHALGPPPRRRHDEHWSYRELDRRARIAAWRLRALDLEPGDRILTWSPVDPGAAGRLLRRDARPARLRPARPAHVGRRGRGHRRGASGARHLILGTGRDAPDPREARPERLPDDDRRGALRRARAGRPALPARLGGPPGAPGSRPAADEIFELDLHVGHDRHAEGRDARPTTTSSPRSSRSTGSSRRWSTGSCRSCRSRTCSSRRSGCTTRSTSGPTSCTSGAATRGSSSTRCATTG